MIELQRFLNTILCAIGAGRSATVRILIGFLVYFLFALVVRADTPPQPASDAIPARALEMLSERVQALVDNEEIVGGELVVIKNRRTVFRQAFGWKDHEAEQLLEVDSIYCVRSMTKPLVGTAIQMLIDEGRLRPDTPVHEVLPFFAGPETGKITVEHLLTHTGGFPFTTISRPLVDYADLAAVAAEAAATELRFEPGTRFEYSDAGSDTLGAIVAKITGAPVEQFIQERILDPLGMKDTVVLLGDDDDVLARIPSAYSGGTGNWSKHWEPSDPPIFPLFLTSQSLYSTTTDYARFLSLWMDGGRVGDKRLLSEAAVERGLTPNQAMSNYPQVIEGLDVHYGQQWMVYSRPDDDGFQPVLFGHGGSDGTHAWAWPELDLMVLFFTQSRGTLAGLGLEGALQTLLVEQKLDDPSLMARVPSVDELEQVAGMYWDETNETAYYVITPRGKGLTLERPGRAHLVFKAGETLGRFVHEVDPQVAIEFVRSEDGMVTGMRTLFGGQVELGPRHVPREGLPSVAEVIASVKRAHGVDKLSGLGIVRMSGTLTIETRKVEVPFVTLFDSTRARTEIRFSDEVEQIGVIDDGRVWSYATPTGASELDGQQLEQALLDRIPVKFGDWTQHYESVEVLKRIHHQDKSLLLVRVVPYEAPGSTMFVLEDSGRVFRTDSLAQVPGVGILGVQTRYGDFRDVDGLQLPFRTEAKYSSPLIGRVVTQADEAETGVTVPEDTFAALTKAGE